LDNFIDLKLIVLGEGGVGKTSIVRAFTGNDFSIDYLPTIGSSTIKKDYKLKKQGKTIRVSIWDFGGQRSFNPFNPAFFKNVDISLFVFDLSKPEETLENIKKEFIEKVQGYSEDFNSIIVGNKLDLIEDLNKIKNAISLFLSEKENFLLTSAKTGENIDKCFELMIHTFLKKAELMNPEGIFSHISHEFLELIGKKEEQLKKQLINTANIDSIFEKKMLKTIVTEENSKEKEIKELKYYDFLKQELEKNSTQKRDIIDQFLINLSELDKMIKHLQKSRFKSAEDLVPNLKKFLIKTSKEFEKNIEFMVKLNREEFELVEIISKTKEELKKYSLIRYIKKI
jgi:small GTP-binding protein